MESKFIKLNINILPHASPRVSFLVSNKAKNPSVMYF